MTLASTPMYQDLMSSIRGFILESPHIALAFKPSPLSLFFGRIAGKILPHVQIKRPIPPKDLTRDPAVIKSLEEDQLCEGTGTLEMFANMLDRAMQLEKGSLRLNKGVKSIWLGHGTNDLAVSHPASKKWFEAQNTVEDKTFKSYDGWYHQLHADLPDLRLVFSKDVGDWILERIGAAGATVDTETVAPQEPAAEASATAEVDVAETSAATNSAPGAGKHSTLPVEGRPKL